MADPANYISEHEENTGPGGKSGVLICWLEKSQAAQKTIIVST